MELGPVSSSQGLSGAFQSHAEKAKRLARPESDPRLERDLAELPSDADNVSAQAKVIKTKDRMLGDLLDIVA